MKKLLTIGLFLLLTMTSFAQTDGINYQAVIIGPDALELPGVDSESNYLPSTTVSIRFTIFDSVNEVEFQEIQTTTTDEFGRINLIIGDVEHDYFETISWDGTAKDLAVEIDFDGGSNFVDMSREVLTFVPYAYHRNITATGTLDVDDDTFLNRELTVGGPTNLNSTLTVNDGNETSLTGDLTVDGETNLNNTLNVNDQSTTNLSGYLVVGDSLNRPDAAAPTILNGSLAVYGESSFTGLVADTLTVNVETHLDNLVNIGNSNDDLINVRGTLNVQSSNQIRLSSTMEDVNLTGDSDKNINNYPLLVEGSDQGIAIKINGSDTTNKNNFISFWDETAPSTSLPEPALGGIGNVSDGLLELFEYIGIDIFEIPTSDDQPEGNTVSYETIADYPQAPMMWGRIEGETDENEFTNNADYNLDKLGYTYDLVDASLDLAWQTIDLIKAGNDAFGATTTTQPCVGLVPCVAIASPSEVYAAYANLALEVLKAVTAVSNEAFAVRNLALLDYHKRRFKGVSYASGAGDYAEYLPRINLSEEMSYGDIVGLYGGEISKKTDGAQRMMVISYKPAVLGALPQAHEEKNYEKVAFMGQVLVKVFGTVNVGDYIIPSGNNNGLGIAIAPEDISSKDIKNIVGVAWDASSNQHGFKLINVAVGINNNDNTAVVEKLETQVAEQAQELSDLKKLLAETIDRLANLENGGSTTTQKTINSKSSGSEDNHIDHETYETSYSGDIVYLKVKDEYIEEGLKLAEAKLIEQGVDIEKHIFNKVKKDPAFKAKLVQKMKERMTNALHYHKEIDEKAGH